MRLQTRTLKITEVTTTTQRYLAQFSKVRFSGESAASENKIPAVKLRAMRMCALIASANRAAEEGETPRQVRAGAALKTWLEMSRRSEQWSPRGTKGQRIIQSEGKKQGGGGDSSTIAARSGVRFKVWKMQTVHLFKECHPKTKGVSNFLKPKYI